MNDLIEALKIFRKYTGGEIYNPTHCEHDTFMVLCTHEVSRQDAIRLEELGFSPSDHEGVWQSFRFGSA